MIDLENAIASTSFTQDVKPPTPNGISPEYYEREVLKLEEVIKAHSDEAPRSSWWDVFCFETDLHTECYQGSLRSFAKRLFEKGWVVVAMWTTLGNRDRLLCPACAQKEYQPTEDEMREDFQVYEARKR